MNVNGLWKSFDGKEILRDVTFSVRNDEIVCLMGPSGVGKTTLLRILMGLEKPDRGQRTDLPKRFSADFQEETLCEPFSAFRNVRIACPKTVSDAEIFQALLEVGLTASEVWQPVCEYSGGMKRRCSLVRALLGEGSYLFLDEPFKGLDEENRKKAISLLFRMRNGRGCFLVTHDLSDAEALGATVLTL